MISPIAWESSARSFTSNIFYQLKGDHMATSMKEYQKRWKEKQRQARKKQVTVVLSEEAYNGLKKQKQLSDDSFSVILNNLILKVPKPVYFGDSSRKNTSNNSHDRFEELLEDRMNEIKSAWRELRQDTGGRIQADELLYDNNETYRFIVENSYDAIYRANLNEDTFEYISPAAERIFGYKPQEIKAVGFYKMTSLIHPDDYKNVTQYFKKVLRPGKKERNVTIEHRFRHKTLGYRWISNAHTLVFDDNDRPVSVIGIVRDIHKRKQAEIALQNLHNELEEKIRERTESLHEANAALRLMLKREEEVKAELEDKVLSNVKELALPYLEELKKIGFTDRQESYANMLESSLNEIISPFLRSLSSKFVGLTHAEIQVADLVKHGKNTKEIAELLNLSTRTIEFHRANIRKKVGLRNEKTPLRSYLQSME